MDDYAWAPEDCVLMTCGAKRDTMGLFSSSGLYHLIKQARIQNPSGSVITATFGGGATVLAFSNLDRSFKAGSGLVSASHSIQSCVGDFVLCSASCAIRRRVGLYIAVLMGWRLGTIPR